MPYPITLIYTTVASLEEAQHLAREAIRKNLVFCVNIIPGGVSIYQEEGEIRECQECYVLFKGGEEKKSVLKEWILTHHPYQTPLIMEGQAKVNEAYWQVMSD